MLEAEGVETGDVLCGQGFGEWELEYEGQIQKEWGFESDVGA